VGNAGVTVNPDNIDSITKGMEEVLLAPAAKYNSYIEKGLAQVKKFSWEETARKTLRIITNVKG
jgi:glycosyltransferase involved in cell wall biosynthesis